MAFLDIEHMQKTKSSLTSAVSTKNRSASPLFPTSTGRRIDFFTHDGSGMDIIGGGLVMKMNDVVIRKCVFIYISF